MSLNEQLLSFFDARHLGKDLTVALEEHESALQDFFGSDGIERSFEMGESEFLFGQVPRRCSAQPLLAMTDFAGCVLEGVSACPGYHTSHFTQRMLVPLDQNRCLNLQQARKVLQFQSLPA